MNSLKSSKLQKLLSDADLILGKGKNPLAPKVSKTDVDIMFSSVLAREQQLSNQYLTRPKSALTRPTIGPTRSHSSRTFRQPSKCDVSIISQSRCANKIED